VLNLLDNWEDEGFTIVVSVGAYTEIYLLGILIILEVSGEREDGISRSLLNVDEVVSTELGGFRVEMFV